MAPTAATALPRKTRAFRAERATSCVFSSLGEGDAGKRHIRISVGKDDGSIAGTNLLRPRVPNRSGRH